MKHIVALALATVIAVFVLWTALLSYQSQEPRYANHRLSEWVDAFDTNQRFSDEISPRSGFTDEEIHKALDAIGEKACPFLMKWLQEKPSPLKDKLNNFLNYHAWTHFIHFRFSPSRVSLAESGFQYYGTVTKTLQPRLIRMTLSQDADRRLCGYEAFYFSRPDKDVFLAVAYRGLSESDSGIRTMTAQWLVERFPEEAERAGVRHQYPQYYSLANEQTNAASSEMNQ
jgi:hypothetical protein